MQKPKITLQVTGEYIDKKLIQEGTEDYDKDIYNFLYSNSDVIARKFKEILKELGIEYYRMETLMQYNFIVMNQKEQK